MVYLLIVLKKNGIGKWASKDESARNALGVGL